MDADIKGCLNDIDRSYRVFEHKGELMTKEQVKAVLEFGISQEFEKVSQIQGSDVDRIINAISAGVTCIIESDPVRITCLICNKTSYSSNDAKFRYCVSCDRFHK